MLHNRLLILAKQTMLMRNEKSLVLYSDLERLGASVQSTIKAFLMFSETAECFIQFTTTRFQPMDSVSKLLLIILDLVCIFIKSLMYRKCRSSCRCQGTSSWSYNPYCSSHSCSGSTWCSCRSPNSWWIYSIFSWCC